LLNKVINKNVGHHRQVGIQPGDLFFGRHRVVFLKRFDENVPVFHPTTVLPVGTTTADVEIPQRVENVAGYRARFI
jgi:hypothetical protein